MFPFKCLTTILVKLKVNYNACTGLMLNDSCMRHGLLSLVWKKYI